MTIKTTDIQTKLSELGSPVDELCLGDFDAIGEFTAKKNRARDKELYRTAGCFFRPNYERGMLATAMIRRYRPTRILEIGFGRGYWATCAGKAMHECGIDGEIISVDINFDKAQIENMTKLFPQDWLKRIQMMQGRSIDVIPKIEGDFDLVYIDGDHTYQAVKADWGLVQERFKQFVIFDDYHLPVADQQAEIKVAQLVDELDEKYERELVVMDRMIFLDDRPEFSDGTKEKAYGQVILRHPDFQDNDDPYSYDW